MENDGHIELEIDQDDTFYSLVADENPHIPDHEVSIYQGSLNSNPPPPEITQTFGSENPTITVPNADREPTMVIPTPAAEMCHSAAPTPTFPTTSPLQFDHDTVVLDPNMVAGVQFDDVLGQPTTTNIADFIDPDQSEMGSIASAVSPDSLHVSPAPETQQLTGMPRHPALEQFQTSMQSISLSNSTDNFSQFSDFVVGDTQNDSAGDFTAEPAPVNFATSDVVEMPTPPLTLTASNSTQNVSSPTSYFGGGTASFVQQITPDPAYDVINEDVSDSSIDSELWLPSTGTSDLIKQSLSKSLEQQFLTQARPSNTVPFVSPAIELVMKYHGEQAVQRLQTQLPPVAESSLKHLVKEGRLLSAVNILSDLLNKDTAMSVKNIKLWTLRFALLIKLKLFTSAEVEMSMFGSLDNCDLYYEYYPAEWPGRKGSIVPWSLRLLWAILPLHCPSIGGLYGALDRMYGLVYHLDQAVLAGLPYVQEQRVTKYKTSLLVQIAGALAGTGGIQPAIKVLNQVKSLRPDISVPVTSAMVRLYYQVGNIHKGECLLASIQDKLTEEETEMNAGFKAIGHGEYKEAYQHFARVVNLNPANTVASINGAVCLLYLGRLGDSIIQFEGAVKTPLHPMLLFNLVSLYELKTVSSTRKKYFLLDNITSNSDWEAFPFECLRL